MWPRRSETGFTLVELLVVLMLLGVVGGVVVSGIVSAFRSSVESQTRIEARQELELTAQQLTRVLRSANRVIILGNDPDFTIGAELVSATYSGNIFFGVEDEPDQRRLVECRGVDETCLDDPDARQLVALIANERPDPDIVGDVGQPVFRYLDRDDEPIEGDPLALQDPRAGASVVTITLMRELSGDRNPVIVESHVAVRSTRYFGSDS